MSEISIMHLIYYFFGRQDTVPVLDMSAKDLKKRIDCKMP